MTVPNLTTIGLNVAGAAVLCAGGHRLTGTSHADWYGFGVGIGLCVLANLAGLVQASPIAGSDQAGK